MAAQRPAAVPILQEKSGAPAWKSIPSWALVATQDNVIAKFGEPQLQNTTPEGDVLDDSHDDHDVHDAHAPLPHAVGAGVNADPAVHGHGVALGDTMTASSLLARGQLVTPFKLSVPAVDAFYVACRNDLKAMPIVRVFVDWLFAEHPQ